MVSRVWRRSDWHTQQIRGKCPKLVYVAKVRDVVGLFEPPERATCACVDEKAQIQAAHRTHRVPDAAPLLQPSSHDYVRTARRACMPRSTSDRQGYRSLHAGTPFPDSWRFSARSMPRSQRLDVH